jgi:nucleotide-binding universal stress UspA family protein
MRTIKNILVPMDFGEASKRALDYALGIASKFQAKVTIITSVYFEPLMYVDGIALPIDDITGAAQGALDNAVAAAQKLAQSMGNGVIVEGKMVKGEPWEQIIAQAKELPADLIAMGTHGRRGLARIFMGSVAEKVVRSSPIPVLTVGVPPEAKTAEKQAAA